MKNSGLAAEKNPNGRPTKYDPNYNEQAYKLCLLGATDKDLANFFEVEEPTINNWKKEYPDFFQSLKAGKQVADSVIATKLFHRAKGYEHVETITASFQGKITDQRDVIKHYAPDTTAAIFWLKNRQPEKWRDVQRIEQTNVNSDPIITQSISNMSYEDLQLMVEILERAQVTGEIEDIPSDE